MNVQYCQRNDILRSYNLKVPHKKAELPPF